MIVPRRLFRVHIGYFFRSNQLILWTRLRYVSRLPGFLFYFSPSHSSSGYSFRQSVIWASSISNRPVLSIIIVPVRFSFPAKLKTYRFPRVAALNFLDLSIYSISQLSVFLLPRSAQFSYLLILGQVSPQNNIVGRIIALPSKLYYLGIE